MPPVVKCSGWLVFAAFSPVWKLATPVWKPATPANAVFTPVCGSATRVNAAFTPVEESATPVWKPATPVWKPTTRVNESATLVATAFTGVNEPATGVGKPFTGVAEACATRIGAFTIDGMSFLDGCLVTLIGAALFVTPLAAATTTAQHPNVTAKDRAKIQRTTLYWKYPHDHPGGATPDIAMREGDLMLLEFAGAQAATPNPSYDAARETRQ